MATPPYNPNIPPPNDPRNDPRWQRAQNQAWQAQARASRDAWKAQARAQKDQWRAYRRSLRRTSLVGPLLLVAIGVVFLLVHSGRVSVPNFATWYADWWPGILIAIGLFMFAEWGISRARRASDAPPLRYNLGAGFGFLVFLLIASGIAASAAKEHSFDFGNMKINGEDWDHFAGSKHENDPAPIVRPLAAGSILTIDNARGDVAVTGLSDDGQLHLTAHNEVYSQSDDDAQDKLKQLEARIVTSGETMSVTIPTIDSGHSDITAQVPAGTQITINANRGDVHVSNIKANVTVTANHGDIDLKGITGAVIAHINQTSSSLAVASVTGPVTVEGRGDEINLSDIAGKVNVKADFFGGGHMQHIRDAIMFQSSKITFSLARLDGEVNIDGSDDFNVQQAVGPVTVDTRNRNITLTRVSGDLTVQNKNGEVEIGAAAPLGAVRVDNHNGSVHLSIPDRAGFTVQADTTDGEVHSDFSLASRSSENAGSLSGTVGGGGHAIRLTTTHGDIALRKADLAPLPPVPPAMPVLRVPEPPAPPVLNQTADAERALIEAKEAVKKAEQQMHQAQEEAKRDRDQALKEANKERQDALREANRAREEALKEAQKAREDGLREARKAREEALREANKAREEARRNAHANND
jgi:hypothetical protein